MSQTRKPDGIADSQIQYQLLNAKLAIGNSYDSAEDAPGGVNEALVRITTAMNLISDPEQSLSEAKPDGFEEFVQEEIE